MTTVDKTLKTLIWVAFSAAVTAVLSYITDNPALFNPIMVAVVNVASVAIKNISDPKVRNI